MRFFATVLMLAAMATAALAQDPNPNGNRMNDPLVRRVLPWESTVRAALPDPYGNRLNVVYGRAGETELSGGPNPYGNRMNVVVPKHKAPTPPVKTPPPVYPEPTP